MNQKWKYSNNLNFVFFDFISAIFKSNYEKFIHFMIDNFICPWKKCGI